MLSFPQTISGQIGDAIIIKCDLIGKPIPRSDRFLSKEEILDAHPPDQCMKMRLNLWPPSPRARPPTPVIANAGTTPAHQCLRLENREDLQNRWNSPIQLDKEPAVAVRQPDPALSLTPQYNQLMSKNRIFGLKSAFRFEWCGQAKTAITKHSSAIMMR
jgi:hypothetical protein